MKATISIVDDEGRTFEGSIELTLAAGQGKPKLKAKSAPKAKATSAPKPESLSYSMNVRAFMKKHSGAKSAHAKYALLVARLAGGKVGTEIAYEKAADEWNRMKSVLGGELRAVYALRAKENGWLDSPKRGIYVLTDSWCEALEG